MSFNDDPVPKSAAKYHSYLSWSILQDQQDLSTLLTDWHKFFITPYVVRRVRQTRMNYVQSQRNVRTKVRSINQPETEETGETGLSRPSEVDTHSSLFPAQRTFLIGLFI
jgi:hypothetical protein